MCAWPYAQFEKIIAEHLKPGERTRPSGVAVPPFYPDTPIVRRILAREYDCVRALDRSYVGPLLKPLDEDGLAEDTTVFLFSDHGSGLPRGKRTVYDSGTRVPLLIRFPKKFAALAPARKGSVCGDLVGFADFAPTVLALAGVPLPAWMDGMAAIDVALRDIRGKAAGQPIWRLLGGVEPRVKCYAGGIDLYFSEQQLLKQTEGFLEAGFQAIKVKVGRENVAEDAERVAAVRRLVGSGFPLMADANCRWSVGQAVEASHRLADSGLYWLEEPTVPDDIEGFARIAKEGGRPLATGENMHTP